MGKTNKKFIKAAMLVSIVILAVMITGLSYLKNRYKILIDTQVVKCIPGTTFYLVDLTDKKIERNQPYAIKMKGLQKFIKTADPKLVSKKLLQVYKDGEYLIKMVSGLPGDKVKVTMKETYINDTPITGGGLLLLRFLQKDPEMFLKEYKVRKDSLYISGLTRNSFDSRYFGVVDHEQVLGRAYPIF